MRSRFYAIIISSCRQRRYSADACALPFLLASAGTDGGSPAAWRLIAASIASVLCLGASMLLFRSTLPGKICGYLAIVGCGIAGFPYFAAEPQIALLGGVVFIQSIYFLREFRIRQHPSFLNSPEDRSLQRARAALWTVPPLAFSGFFLDPAGHEKGESAITAALLISQGLVAHWTGRRQTGLATIVWIILPVVASLGGLFAFSIGQARLAAVAISLLTLVVLPRPRSPLEYHERWWEPFLNHPARVPITTFLG